MVDRGRVGGSSHNSNIVGVSSSIGIVDGESSSNLSNGVGIGIRVSLTLAIVVPSISMDGWGSISMNSRVSIGSMGVGRSSIGSVSMVDRGRVGCSSHNTNIVRVSSSIGIMDREPSSNLSNGVGIGIRVSLSFTLAIVVPSISMDRCGRNNAGVDGGGSNNSRVSSRSSHYMVSISKVSNTSISNMSSIGTVTNSSNTTDNTIRVVNTSYYTSMG